MNCTTCSSTAFLLIIITSANNVTQAIMAHFCSYCLIVLLLVQAGIKTGYGLEGPGVPTLPNNG